MSVIRHSLPFEADSVARPQLQDGEGVKRHASSQEPGNTTSANAGRYPNRYAPRRFEHDSDRRRDPISLGE